MARPLHRSSPPSTNPTFSGQSSTLFLTVDRPCRCTSISLHPRSEIIVANINGGIILPNAWPVCKVVALRLAQEVGIFDLHSQLETLLPSYTLIDRRSHEF